MPDREQTIDEPTRQERVSLSPTQLCREVERTQPREHEDRVRCAHLFGDYFRCNWWSRAVDSRSAGDYDWSVLLTDHIRRSSFLKVTMVAGQLVVEEMRDQTPVDRGR